MTAVVRGTRVDTLSLTAAVEHAIGWIARRNRTYLCFANVHVVETAARDAGLAKALRGSTLTLPDGSPVAWAASRKLGRNVDRITGSDVFDTLIRRPRLRHFFYGSTNETLALLAGAVAARYPEATVCGTHAPPFRALDDDELLVDAARINGAAPDVVWVGLGAPRQEIWMARVRPHVEAPLLIGVGAVFDFIAGTRARAPKWMQQLGLEWLHRLCQEPRRLGPRYVKTNASFIGWAIRARESPWERTS